MGGKGEFIKILVLGFLWVAFQVTPTLAFVGFSASLTQPNYLLGNGANDVYSGATGSSWSTSAPGFSDGNFAINGGYSVETAGVYYFYASVLLEVATSSAPNQNVDIRIVKCTIGSCSGYCHGNNPGVTLIQGGDVWLGSGIGFSTPAYALSASYIGTFNVGDEIALCVDNWATTNSVKLVCPGSGTCTFGGFLV